MIRLSIDANRFAMDGYELGKRAAELVHRSVTIRMCSPEAKKKARKGMEGKNRNSSSPWRQGRKPTKRKQKE